MVRSQKPRDGGTDPGGADARGERDADVPQREALLATVSRWDL